MISLFLVGVYLVNNIEILLIFHQNHNSSLTNQCKFIYSFLNLAEECAEVFQTVACYLECVVE